MIRRYCVANPFASSAKIRANLPLDQRSICTSTIRQRLIKQNLRAYKPVKKPFLSAKNIRDRITFINIGLSNNGLLSCSQMRQTFHSFAPIDRQFVDRVMIDLIRDIQGQP